LKNFNFGNRIISPVESVNFYLKSFVINGNSTVEEVGKQLMVMVKVMERSINEALDE